MDEKSTERPTPDAASAAVGKPGRPKNDTATEKFDDDGRCILVKWPMRDYPTPENSVTAGKTRAQIVEWIGDDDARALVVLREESDKFDDADPELLWACHNVIAAKAV